MSDIKTDKLTGKVVIPKVDKDSALDIAPHLASKSQNEALGFPGSKIDNWQEKAIVKMGDLLSRYKSLKVYMDICVRCGACADKCHYFLGTGDPNNMPVARAELMRKVYRKNFGVGRLWPHISRSENLTEEVLDEWWSYFHQCSQCRRCSVFCPFGIDTAEISMAAREIMNSIGVGQKHCNEALGKVVTVGNNLGIDQPALANTLGFLEEEIKEESGVAVKYPIDQKDSDVLLVAPSADYFSEPHIEGFIGYGKVFHEAGVSWTVSSYASEFANFGMFIGSYDTMKKVAMRIREAAEELNVKRIIVGECGHAWRVAYNFWNTLIGPLDFLAPRHQYPTHICEYTLDLLNRGALKIDKTANDDRVVTFHDSCNVARASRMGDKPQGQFDIPRAVIKAVCNNYVEMDAKTTKELTYCCGGGGGLLTDELLELRVKGAMPRANALKAVMDEKGVNTMAMICAICKTQFTEVLPKYDIDREMVAGVLELVSGAIILGGKKGV